MQMFFLMQTDNGGLFEFLERIFIPFFIFFRENGELGLFIYSIIETITPLAGVEIILFPLLLASPTRWWLITLNLVTANTIGAAIVHLFMAKKESGFYNRFVKPDKQERAKKLFDRYGVWAIFIFAMTPLPFFIIIFTAAIARMKLGTYLVAVFLSRGARFMITSYAVAQLGASGEVILWLAIIGIAVVVIMSYVQKRALRYFETQASTNDENEPQEAADQA